jgi:hypothetical protein
VTTDEDTLIEFIVEQIHPADIESYSIVVNSIDPALLARYVASHWREYVEPAERDEWYEYLLSNLRREGWNEP